MHLIAPESSVPVRTAGLRAWITRSRLLGACQQLLIIVPPTLLRHHHSAIRNNALPNSHAYPRILLFLLPTQRRASPMPRPPSPSAFSTGWDAPGTPRAPPSGSAPPRPTGTREHRRAPPTWQALLLPLTIETVGTRSWRLRRGSSSG